jgi:hypothetical protein
MGIENIHIDYDHGNFSITREKIGVLNLEDARKYFRDSMENYHALIKSIDQWNFEDHAIRWFGWYNRITFKDIYFCKGFLFTMNGVSSPLVATYNDLTYVPQDQIKCEAFDKTGNLIGTNIGKSGREAKISDPGEIEIIVEGYNNIRKKKPTIENLIGLPIPLLIENKR